jgi:hypothetical protein
MVYGYTNSFRRRTRSKALHEFKLHRQEKFLYICDTLHMWRPRCCAPGVLRRSDRLPADDKALLINDPEQQDSSLESRLAAVYGLTRAEARLAAVAHPRRRTHRSRE